MKPVKKSEIFACNNVRESSQNESEFNQWKDILIIEAFNEKVWFHYDHSNYNQETKSVPNYLNQPDYNEKQ